MLVYGLAYGWLSARRRIRHLVLPAVTTATGALLVVIVFSMSSGIRSQSAGLGHADEIGHAVTLIAVTVLLVGVVEVAVATTRTIAQRTRELGVLGATGVRSRPIVVALLVEPTLAALVGSVAGSIAAVLLAGLLDLTGTATSGISVPGTAKGVAIAIGLSLVAAVLTSIAPSWRAVSRPPIRSLSST